METLSQLKCQIYLFGSLRVVLYDRQVVTRFRTVMHAKVFARMACRFDETLDDDTLADDIWDQQEIEERTKRPHSPEHPAYTARKDIRKTLKEPDIEVKVHHGIHLNLDRATVDVEVFHRRLKQASGNIEKQEKARRLLDVIGLYTDDLLPSSSFYMKDINILRSTWRTSYLNAMVDLASLYEYAAMYEHARIWCIRAIEQANRRYVYSDSITDPLIIWQSLYLYMRTCIRMGKPEDALFAYEKYKPSTREHDIEISLNRWVTAIQRNTVEALVKDWDKVFPLILPTDVPTAEQVMGREVASNRPMFSSPTKFFGRAEETRLLLNELKPRSSKSNLEERAESARLVTLIGPGGIGKTRLAKHVAFQLVPEYGNDIWFVSLEGITQPSLFWEAVAEAVKVPPSPKLTSRERVLQALGGKQALIVLDNFEQLVKQTALDLDEALARCTRLTCLVTSRQALRLQREHLRQVLPLPVPETADTGNLMVVPSVELLVDRAKSVKPQFEVTEDNAKAVGTLSARLEGIPLAIELAAALMLQLTPSQMVKKMDDRFKLLIASSPYLQDLPERHRSLRATIDVSFHLLSGEHQRFLACLSVFRGGWSLDAATAVCEQPLAFGYLHTLITYSLVRTEEVAESMRYHILETIREYAEEKLLQSGEHDAARDRHQAFFMGIAEQAEAHLTSTDAAGWMDYLEIERANLRHGLDWKVSEVSIRLAGALGQFWAIRSYFTEGEYYLTKFLDSGVGSAEAQAKAFRHAAACALYQSNLDEAEARYRKSLMICKELGDKQGEVEALVELGSVAQFRGKSEKVKAWFEEALALARNIDYKKGLGTVLHVIATLAYNEGDMKAAKVKYEESLNVKKEMGDLQGIGIESHGLGNVAQWCGDYTAAEAFYSQALEIKRKMKGRWGLVLLLVNMAHLACCKKEYGKAGAQLKEALEVAEKLTDSQLFAIVFEGFARLKTETAQPEDAARLWGQAEKIRSNNSSPLLPMDQTQQSAWRDAACDIVGEKEFEVCRSEGYSWAIEQAVSAVRARMAENQ